MTNCRCVYGVLVFCVGTACLLQAGCASTRPQAFSNSFLPSTPLVAALESPIDLPPPPKSSFYISEMPNLIPRTPPEIERRLTKSQELFEAGKRDYEAGDIQLARHEFDRALDALLSAPEDMPDRHRLENRLDELVDSIYRIDLDHLGAADTKSEIVFDKSPLETMLGLTFPIDPKLKPKVKEEIQATVSKLPLQENDTVLSYINFFSTDSGRRTLITALRRSGRYKPLIQRILDEEGVPQELLYLAQAESAFLPRAVSNKQATGIWQFMHFTGQEYGLQANAFSDERLDPEKSTRAAARHLRDLFATFGDWNLAMAAYNCGPACVDHAVQRTGFADFWELSARNALPKQTLHYVPLIQAITVMTKNAKDYGLENIELDKPFEYDSFTLTASTSIDLIADAADRQVSEIRELNPALLRSVAPAGYQVHVPKGSGTSVVSALENIPESRRLSWRLHRVERGETLAALARRFGAAPDTIASANNRTVDAPEAGDLLVIPLTPLPDHRFASRTHRAASHQASRLPARVLYRRASPPAAKTAVLIP